MIVKTDSQHRDDWNPQFSFSIIFAMFIKLCNRLISILQPKYCSIIWIAKLKSEMRIYYTYL